jgi:Zn-dependent oligopeptidase
MSNKRTRERAAEDKREGKSPSTQAGEFVREEIHHVRDGKHGARSAKQVIAIGLSKARRAGVELPPPKRATAAVRKQAARDAEVARTHHKPSRARSRAMRKALEHEASAAASPVALSRHARAVARPKGAPSRRRIAKKARG